MITQSTEFMISSDKILTIADPSANILENMILVSKSNEILHKRSDGRRSLLGSWV